MQGQKKIIFDPIRKKFIPLTPEEWVRQHAIQHLLHKFGLSPSLLSIERQLNYKGMKKRFDIAASSPSNPLFCLVECKSPDVAISKETLIQAAVYNKVLNCKWLWLTNGLEHYWFLFSEGTVTAVPEPEKL